MVSKDSDFLYHYTSIDTLALILKNKKLRFNNLLDVDDLDEGIRRDKPWGKYCFVSCWTDFSEESIPMWSMYSRDMKGVRIKLKKLPFVYHEYTGNTTDNDGNIKEHNKRMKAISTEEAVFNRTHMLVTPFLDHLLHPIQYLTDDEIKIKRSINISVDLSEDQVGPQLRATTGQLGKYKSIHWSFQREWRYILVFYPKLNSGAVSPRDFFVPFRDALNGLYDLPFTDYYLMIHEDAFCSMEITFGPKAGEAEKILVESLVEKYNPSAIIKDSVLTGRVQ